MVLDFSRRNSLPEMMDSDETDFETFRACLVDLAKVNKLTFAYRPTLSFFRQLAAAGRLPAERKINVVDVGCGSGDMLRKIDRWAAPRGYMLDLVGVDLNPWSAETSREFAQPSRPIRFITTNIFDYRPDAPIDIIISSLFTHHLEDESVVAFVRWMEANARLGWFINDLYRHPLPYHLFRIASWSLRFHHFVQHDGPVSIARAFRVPDWSNILGAANVPEAAVREYFPYRLCVSRIKQQ